MNVYVSHISALLFWRAWSAVLRIPLRVFHDMRTVDPSLLPFRLYPTSEMLRDCALRGRDVEDLLERGERGARTGDPAAVALTEVTEMVEAGDLRWHVLVARDQGTRNSSRMVRHRTSACYPRQSFIQVAPHVFVCAPELVFIQMALELPFGALLALGYELCGCYPVPSNGEGPHVRRPLSSPRRLASFSARASGAKGARIARSVARQVRAKSGSIMETELAVLCFSPVSRGGFGIIPAKLNESVELSAQAAAATRLKHVVCDAYWPNAAVALEYDGRESHGSASQQDRDSRRRNALVIDGVELTVVTSSRFHNVSGFASLADGLARSVGKPKRKRPSGHLAKHMELRRQIRRYHREHFPFQDG